MIRWVWGLLHGLAVAALVAGAVPPLLTWLSGKGDLPASVDAWAVRRPVGPPAVVRYHVFSAMCHGYLVLYACLWAGRFVIARVAYERRERRAARGLCGVCGYDLRGGSGRCPECGTHRYGADG